jgi:hypothetical protein
MTDAQLQALKADITADPALAAVPKTSDGAFDVAAAYNLVAAPDFWVWRTAVSQDEYVNGVGPDGTTFSWTGTGFITRARSSPTPAARPTPVRPTSARRLRISSVATPRRPPPTART